MFKSIVLILTTIVFSCNSALAAQADANDTNTDNYYCSPILTASNGDIERLLFDSRVLCQEVSSVVQKLKDKNSCYQEMSNFLRGKPSKELSLTELQTKLATMETECKKL